MITLDKKTIQDIFRHGEAVHLDSAGEIALQADEDLHGRRFSGAIGPKKTENIAAVHFKIQIPDCPPMTVMLAKIFSFQDNFRIHKAQPFLNSIF